MSSLVLRKATRKKTKVRIGLSGPSGSGKTYSALLLASGMVPWDKIALIDTENGSGDLYSHLGDYSVLTLTAPYTPERYIEAIQACEKAGIEVIVLDSATHEWDGKGGLLESNEHLAQAKFKGNTWAAWSVTTPRHQKFIEAIVTSPCHIITTVRSKTDTIQTDDKKVKKVGMKEIQREGWEYELTINFNLDRDGNYAMASKDRTEMFINADPFKITAETGKKIMDWANEGIDPPPPPPPSPTVIMEFLTECKTPQQLQTAYDHAFQKYTWKPDEAAMISDCYSKAYARVSDLKYAAGKYFNAAGIMVATAQPDGDKGKVVVVMNKAAAEILEPPKTETKAPGAEPEKNPALTPDEAAAQAKIAKTAEQAATQAEQDIAAAEREGMKAA